MLNGQLLSENKIEGTNHTIEVANYAEGMYILKLIGKQTVEFKKIAVVR